MKTKVEEQINIGDMVNNKEFDMTGYVTNIWKKDNECSFFGHEFSFDLLILQCVDAEKYRLFL